MWGGLDEEDGFTSGAGGEGVVALGAARHVRLDHRHVCLDHVDVQLVLGCAGTVMLTIHSDLEINDDLVTMCSQQSTVR